MSPEFDDTEHLSLYSSHEVLTVSPMHLSLSDKELTEVKDCIHSSHIPGTSTMPETGDSLASHSSSDKGRKWGMLEVSQGEANLAGSEA